MNWEAIGAVGEILGAIAVVATLIYLAIQLRRNTEATQAGTAQALADSINAANLLLAGDPRLAKLYRTGKFENWDFLSPEEKFQWGYFANAACRSFEAVFTNHRLNQADDQTFEMVKETLRTHFTSPAWRNWWREGHQSLPFTRNFIALIEQECFQNEGDA